MRYTNNMPLSQVVNPFSFLVMPFFSDSKPKFTGNEKLMEWISKNKVTDSKRFFVIRINILKNETLEYLELMVKAGRMRLLHIIDQAEGIAGSTTYALFEKNRVDWISTEGFTYEE